MAFKDGKMIPYESRAAFWKDIVMRLIFGVIGLVLLWCGFYCMGSVTDWFPGYGAAAGAWRGLVMCLFVPLIPVGFLLFISTLVAGWGGDDPDKEKN